MSPSYKPDVTIRFLANELAFDGGEIADDAAHDPDAGPRECLEFLCAHGGEGFVERKDDGEIRFQTGKSFGVFENQKKAAFGTVDIKGQI